jgi:hypothetical protein
MGTNFIAITTVLHPLSSATYLYMYHVILCMLLLASAGQHF